MNIDATIAVGFLIVFVLVNIAGALFFHLAEDVTEPGYGSPTPNGGPYRPSSLHHRHSWRYRPGDRTVSPPRRNPCRVFTTPDSVVIESAPDSLLYGQWFTITLTETPTGFKRWDRQ